MNWCWYNPVFTSLTPLLQMKYVCFLSPFLLGDFFKKTLLITNFFQKQLHWSIKGNKLYKISCPPFHLVTFLHLWPDYWVLLSPLIVPVVWAFLFLCFFLPFVCLFCLFVFWKNTSCWQLWQEPPLWVPGGLNLPLYLSLPVSFPSGTHLKLGRYKQKLFWEKSILGGALGRVVIFLMKMIVLSILLSPLFLSSFCLECRCDT